MGRTINLKMLCCIVMLLAGMLGSCQQGYAQKKGVKKIVLDAGHGGRDPGARRFRLIKDEKDIALDVVLKLGKLLNDSLKDVEVIYTRKHDFYPELKERHAIANNANADLFVSIHVNATAGTRTKVQNGYKYVGKGSKRRKVPVYTTVVNRETKATGTETYILGLHRTSQKEKAIEEFGDNVTEEPGLLDENDPMTQILVAQYTQAFQNKSISFGDKVEKSFVKVTGRKSAGVKQKGLEVLAGSAMPGVLIELGFINNVEDEIYLNSEEGQHQLAYAIFRAIREYKAELSR